MEKRVALRYIKSRKKKNIISILTIVLVTAFLMAVGIYAYSYNLMSRNFSKAYDGGFYGAAIIDNEEEVEKIKAHNNVESLGTRILAYMESNSESDIEYAYYDNIAQGYYDLELKSGKINPENNECVIDNLYEKKFNKKIGDKITFLDKELKIVGIVENKKYTVSDNNFYRVFVNENLAKELGGKKEGLIKLIKAESYEEDFESIRLLINGDVEDIFINEGMVSKDMSGSEVIPYILIGLLVVISGIFIIYNIFNIMLVERVKAVGLLLTVGVTGKQVRKIVLYEALFLSVIGIPLGAILGMIGAKATMLGIKFEEDLRFILNPIVFIFVIVVSLITVLISVLLPAFKISKLSPIEASKFTGIEGSKLKKEIKGKDFIDKLAKGNIKKNKKINRITIISMTLSITLFIVAATIFKSMSIKKMVQDTFIENVQVNLSFEGILNGDYIDEEIIKKLEEAEDNVVSLKIIGEKTEGVARKAYLGITDEILKKAEDKIVLGEINKESFKEGKEALVYMSHNTSPYALGEKIIVKDKEGKETEVTVTAILSEPVVKGVYAEGIYIYNDSKVFENTKDYGKILVKTSEKESKMVAEKIEKITGKYKNIDKVENFEDTLIQLKEEKRSYELLGYSIIGVVAIIGLMGFINSTLSEILFRRREFGMLRGVGVTDTQIKKLVQREGILKMRVALIIGVVLGNILAFISVKIFMNAMGATFAVYSFPFIETILCIGVILLVLKVITTVGINKIVKDSIVEQIKIED
ncbi:MAG: ABC transporter permease [Clostridium sp.]|uniref:ABC transporter permease n=1 Tax=Clostridium sp. TaxID=1506 RepID=UPI003F395B0A